MHQEQTHWALQLPSKQYPYQQPHLSSALKSLKKRCQKYFTEF